MKSYQNISVSVCVHTPNYLFIIAKQASLSQRFILQRHQND